MAERQGKVFEKTVVVTRQVRRRGEKEYEYGMVWLLLPKEYIGKKVLVRVFLGEVLGEEGQKPQAQAQYQLEGREKMTGDLYEKFQIELLRRELERLRGKGYRLYG